MKKIMNADSDVVEEMLSGYLSAYSRYYESLPDNRHGILLKNRRKDKVSLLIGGGSGHEPLFAGFVGEGLADAAACGNIFASPNPQLIYETAQAVNQGKGVLFIYGCYAGDNMNFDMAEELCEFDDIPTAHIRVWDDCASAPKERIEDRRGIAGDVYVIKIAGAACLNWGKQKLNLAWASMANRGLNGHKCRPQASLSKDYILKSKLKWLFKAAMKWLCL